ncbi:MAG: MFS transporter [Chloroflexi bacterium]|nr:MAG: MFS transporter [Chloroflexota bacterium]
MSDSSPPIPLPRGERRQVVLGLLHNPSFVALWSGQLLSQVGDRFRFVAVLAIIGQMTDDPLAITFLALSVTGSQVVFGLLGGAAADRFDRKHVMIIADLLRGLLVLPVLLVDSPSRFWIIYVTAVVLEMVSVFFYPARNAALPGIIGEGQLLTANALMQVSYIIALVIGSALAGILVGLLGTAFAIVFDSTTFFISALAVSVMRIPPPVENHQGRPGPREIWEEIRAGIAFIRRRRDLSIVLLITAIAMLGIGAIIVLGLSYLNIRLNVQAEGFGYAVSMMGVGILIGGVVLSRLAGRMPANVLVGGSLVVVGLAIIAFAAAANYAVVLLTTALIGLCLVIARAALDTFTQTLVPDEMLGRVQAAVNMTIAISTTLAQGLAGLLAKVMNSVEAVFMMAGGVTVVAGVAAIVTLREAAAEMARNRLVRAP